MNWQESESELLHVFNDVFQCGGTLVDNLSLQYQDIDAVDRRKNTYSIKNQPSSGKTGNFAFETHLENSTNGNIIDGSFLKCQADYYVIFREYRNVDWCYIIDTEVVKDMVLNGEYRKVTTRTSTEQASNQGRTYDRGHVILTPVQDLYFHPACIVLVKTDKGWKIHNKVKKQ